MANEKISHRNPEFFAPVRRVLHWILVFTEDQEHLVISGGKGKRVSLSQFLSIQREQVSGAIQALPVVAVWEDEIGQVLSVAIGKIKIIQ